MFEEILSGIEEPKLTKEPGPSSKSNLKIEIALSGSKEAGYELHSVDSARGMEWTLLKITSDGELRLARGLGEKATGLVVDDKGCLIVKGKY